MDAAKRVLELLYDRGEGFFALEELAAAAGLDRARLEGAVESLRGQGHELELSPAHGVRLVRPIRLAGHLIERDLGTKRIGRHVICFDEVDSTNGVAFDSARQAAADGLVVLAESQRRGRGRMGRQWLSEPAENVLLSALLLDPDEVLRHEAVTIAAGLSAAEGVQRAVGCACTLKWPNDVLLDGAKVAGVLVEVRRVAGRRCVVVGIGINVNAAPPAGQVEGRATCLAANVGKPVERTEIVREVLRRLDAWTAQIAARKLDGLHDAWVARCGMINQRIAVTSGGRRHVGRVLDVSPLEGLILFNDHGGRIHVPAEGATVIG